LFFNQFSFHKQKIAYHRSTMKYYQAFLEKREQEVRYVSSCEPGNSIYPVIQRLAGRGVKKIHFIDPADDWLERRIVKSAEEHGVDIQSYESPMFLNSNQDLTTFFKPEKKKFFQTSFYQQERKRLNLLLDEEGKPEGGKWTYDSENRKKYPKSKIPPAISFPAEDSFSKEAVTYTLEHFGNNFGSLKVFPLYPNTHKSAEIWLDQFLDTRFHEFGPYEDAIVSGEHFLNHSVLTPMLNVGLLTPAQVIEQTMKFARENSVPLNSLEGFIRQIIGWREFMRGMYVAKGREQRTTNFWGFDRKIPASFYNGTTGILPIDVTIKKILETGYCHHIERLMVLGNFMVLCEFDPDEVYRWFMELFIDAYDWVMVPNVYGMSQFADGGLLSTKPYISGSNYLMKMSNYPKGEWQHTWDALFWRFMNKHRDFFLKNPRLGMLIRTYDKFDVDKKKEIEKVSSDFLMKI
ncbi:MAG: cryptochrome/photolyase family protein, partial [Balneolales bacterium]|nr:cryptochrome/photolyase family protein [Balneolales bacterium]